MSDSDIGFKEISEVHRSEKRSKTLTKLPHLFYELAEEHLELLKDQYKEKSRNPSSTDALIHQDNIKKINKRLCQIYDLRERKIAIAALNGVVGSQPPQNMNSNEVKMYNELISTLKRFRDCPIDEPVEVQTSIISEPTPAEPVPEPVAAKGGFPEDEEVKKESITCLVRVLEEIPPFVDVDQTYDLKKEDVVTLPEKFARILSLKGAVKILDV